MPLPSEVGLPPLHEWLAELAGAAIGGLSTDVDDDATAEASAHSERPDEADSFDFGIERIRQRAGLSLARLTVDLPVEMDVVSSGGGVRLLSSPPTQFTATTIFPTLHRVRVTVAAYATSEKAGPDA